MEKALGQPAGKSSASVVSGTLLQMITLMIIGSCF